MVLRLILGKSILKLLEPFSIAKRFQTSKKALVRNLKPWGFAPNPTTF
jgi:hypothetical protein